MSSTVLTHTSRYQRVQDTPDECFREVRFETILVYPEMPQISIVAELRIDPVSRGVRSRMLGTPVPDADGAAVRSGRSHHLEHCCGFERSIVQRRPGIGVPDLVNWKQRVEVSKRVRRQGKPYVLQLTFLLSLTLARYFRVSS